jgi:lipopolysaccharide export system permease protein
MARTRTQLVLQGGVFNRDFPGLTIYAQQADPARGDLRTVFVQDRTHEGVTATILAPTGHVNTDTDRGEIIFRLQNGRIYRQEASGLSVVGFDTYAVRMDLSRLLSDYDLGSVRPKEMSWERLHELRDAPETVQDESGRTLRKVEVEIQKRMALPAACFVLGLFALPMAASFGGLHRHWGLMLALGFFLFYYTLLSLGLSLGEAGVLAPVVGLWLPNALFLAAGVTGLVQAARERGVDIVGRLGHLLRRRPTAEEGGRAR